jgi:hypothetical protein
MRIVMALTKILKVCGDVENIYVASAPSASTDPDDPQFYTRSAVPQIVPDSECNSPCTGAGQYLCGSGNLLTYYAWDGPEPLYTFNFPTGNAAGEYTLLIGGVVVPLMTSQVVTGKVTFTEKYGSGEPNGTGAYELDLSEIDDFSAAWRTMTGLETDVFCSAGLTLPDIAGRQITIGGWAGQSNFGVRLYWPDGSAGVPGTNEWQEDAGVLSLQGSCFRIVSLSILSCVLFDAAFHTKYTVGLLEHVSMLDTL